MGNEAEETLIGKIDDSDADVRKTGQEMDIIRQRTIAYEYLCRLEEAKTWLEACLKEKLPDPIEFEECLRNGVYLAKLGNFISPELLPLNKIYDIDQRRYKVMGLQFKHTDNINKFLQILKKTELPVTFQPETTDIYDKKNMPRVVYCIHALSSHLFKLGKAPLIRDVFGKAVFTDEQLDSVSKDLQKCRHPLPKFQKIGDFYCDVVKEIVECSKDVDVESIANWHKIFQNIINEGNRKSLEHKDHKKAIGVVNNALDVGNPDDLYTALKDPKLGLNLKIDKFSMPLLYEEMRLEKCELERNLNENEIAASVSYLSSIACISRAVERGEEAAVWNSLNSHQINLEGLRPHCRRRYFSALVTALQVKIKEQFECPLLTLDDIRDAIEMVNMKDDDNEELVVLIDSINKAVTGEDTVTLIALLKNPILKLPVSLHKEEFPLCMRVLKKSSHQKESQNLWYEDIVQAINEAWWRRVLVQKKYATLIKMKTIESQLKQERKRNPWAWYKVQEQKIIKIQALWRGRRARQAFVSLFHSPNPPLKIVKKFIPVLDFATEDYDREIELQTLKSEVVQSIRKNQELSKQIDDMDLKIGLLVQNRIALQEVAAHGLKLNNLVKHNSMTKLVFQNREGKGSLMTVSTAVKGLKSLTKECKRLLDGYQHLFYELQTNPTYLSKLLFCIPQNKTNFFLQNVVLSLYNFGAYARDEYLLLKLFRFTLEEEISCKITKPFDIIASTPLVLKMAVSLSRQLSGLNSLQSIIGPLVEMMLKDKDMNIETGPVEIYKAWRNETEMKTGQISKLPYTVTQEEALTYPEVKSRLQIALTQLKSVVTMFLDKIINSTELIPFCITYMARVLHRSLTSKFPHTPEKDILKVIGNLVYYQFLNAAIVAPDAFHIINMPNGAGLTTDQRKNLASVAKILHFSAAKKGFGEESSHLRCLNPFIVECHEKMKELFRRCCRGPTLEEYFAVDEYTEATLLHHPHIYITVQEIVDTHALLVEYQDILAPDPNDRLNDLLDELGDVPTVAQLASRDLDCQAADAEENARLEVCLALVNKFQAPTDDMTDLNKLFIKTKELCVAIIPFLDGEHLLEALCIGTTKEQQELYSEKVQKRIYSGQARPDEAMTLREHIAKLRRNLQMLEDEGYVTREDGYQALVTSIALDLCNKGKYRQAQRRALATLTRTKQSLIEKTKYYEEKCKSYDQYIKSCLANLHTGKKSVHACLRRSDHYGVFTVKGKFMGVEMESIDIDIQDLLQKQYEGCAIIDLFAQCHWPSLHEANWPFNLKTLIIADTHLLGPYRGHWLDKWRREFQMHQAFQAITMLHKPDVVFVLGDLFDEGEWSNETQFQEYVYRFFKLFALPENIKMYVVAGNHDIGFHNKSHKKYWQW
ncbi:unnamed protein product, partial [Iphiclides podalirius]